ncbi:MAG TPA: Gfo/Idh/MocA family oxidoreductase [Chloroflexota bacterium]|nr:Gfo/Idh/MocA family oxidoreductase [Chloroflexota bacterium]
MTTDSPAKPSRPVKAAFVGAGVMGRDHWKNALTLQQEGDLQITGLADVVLDRANTLAGEHGIATFEDYKKLIDETKPEFVVVSTPHPSHEEITVYAAERGIHVLCEKPIAHTVAAADRMIAACRKAGVLLGIDFSQRPTPTYQKAHDIIANGELGEIYRVNFIASGWYRTQAYYDSGGWRGTWEGEGGGVIMNQAPHHLDLYCWLAGLPQSVKATALTRIHEIEVENTVAALLTHSKERVDSFYTTTAEWPGRTEITIAGQKGRMVISERNNLRLYRLEKSLSEELLTSPHGSKPAGDWEEIEVAPAPRDQVGHIAMLRRFADTVREEGPEEHLYATGEDGRKALELANAMLLSSYRDKTVTIPTDRADYEKLLEELRTKARNGEFKKRQRTEKQEQVLSVLPDAT